MKSFILIIFFLPYLFVQINAQIMSDKLILESSINFYIRNAGAAPFNPSQTPIVNLREEERQTNFNTTVGLGYTFLNRHLVGGLYRYSSRELVSESQSYQSDITTEISSVKNFIRQRDVVFSKSFGVYYRYFLPITEKFIFSPRLSALWISQEYNKYSFSYFCNPDYYSTSHYLNIQKFYRLELNGLLSYHFNNWLGIQAKIFSGVFQVRRENSKYGSNNYDPKNKKITFDANPINWEIGVLFLLGNHTTNKEK